MRANLILFQLWRNENVEIKTVQKLRCRFDCRMGKGQKCFLKWGGNHFRVTIGVFENNEPAYLCYKKVGFVETEIVQDEPWNVVEMEIVRNKYYEK